MVGDAYDGPVALEQICKTQPDCVIMDLALPGLNGTDIIRHVHEKFSHIQFIIVSALDEDFCKNQIEDLSYVKFITKPFDAEQISEALQLAEQNLEKAKHG